MIGLIRESGGYGDIICTGAAALAIKQEHPHEEVVLYVPDIFVESAEHLVGVDRVISLGCLRDIQPHRRPRDSAMDCTRFPYLKPVLHFPDAHYVDLYCLTGDTSISLVDGTEVAIKDLVGRDPFWVYSYDHESGKIVPGKATAHKTRENAELVEVELNNGEKVRCTPDHRWMLRDGSYRQAQELQPEDSLMPLYRRYDHFLYPDYELLLQPSDEKWYFTHRQFVGSKPVEFQGKYGIVHHASLSRRNNCPDQLEWMTRDAHQVLHMQSEEARARIGRGVRESWTPERRAALSKRQTGEGNVQKRSEVRKKTSMTVRRTMSTPEFHDKLSVAVKAGLHGRDLSKSPEHRKRIGDSNRGRRRSAETRALMCASHADFCGMRNPRYLSGITVGEVCRLVDGLGLSYEEAARELGCSVGTIMKRYRVVPGPRNHRVVAVRALIEREDCYDLSVDEYHNFALTAGVFIHNCPGYNYENSCPRRLRYNRCQLFAMATGAKFVRDVLPEWEVSAAEHELGVSWRVQHELPERVEDLRLIAVQLRGTCSARSIPEAMKEPLVQALSEFGRVVLFDCIEFPFEPPSDSIQCIDLSMPLVAAILEQCTVAVTVDSSLWHLTAALRIPTVGVFGPTDGVVSAQTYPLHEALDGDSEVCVLPCNYNDAKNWRRKCRETGCSRMKAHTVESIVAKVHSVFAKEIE